MIPDGKGSDNNWQKGCTYDHLSNQCSYVCGIFFVSVSIKLAEVAIV